MAFTYHDGSRRLQDGFDTRRLADRLDQRLLFVDFAAERPSRLRVNGLATIDPEDPLVPTWRGAQFVVRVEAREVFPNCPRYIHHMALVERSRYVPREEREVPVPEWKRSDWACDVLPAGDPARAGADR